MKPILCLCLSICSLGYESFASAGKAPGEISVELRAPLSQSGYNKLLKWQKKLPKTKTRKDIYYDIFSTDGFMLAANGYKFRLKNKEQSYALQVSKLIKTQSYQCGSRSLLVKKTENWTDKLSDKQGEKLAAKSLELLQDIEGVSKGLKSNILGFDKFLRKQSDDIFEPLNGLDKRQDFLTSQWNQKIRMEIPFNIEGLKSEALLSQIMDRDPKGKARIRLEIEFEKDPELTMSDREFVKNICEQFKLDQLTDLDFNFNESRGDQFYFDKLIKALP